MTHTANHTTNPTTTATVPFAKQAYNHHYFSWLVGTDAEVFDSRIERRIPNPTKTGVRDLPSAQLHPYPTNIVFKENPGGEFRKSYHGYPAGFVRQLRHYVRPFRTQLQAL